MEPFKVIIWKHLKSEAINLLKILTLLEGKYRPKCVKLLTYSGISYEGYVHVLIILGRYSIETLDQVFGAVAMKSAIFGIPAECLVHVILTEHCLTNRLHLTGPKQMFQYDGGDSCRS